MHKLWIVTITVFLALLCTERPADVFTIWLPSIFADNMVLQRDKPITIWGTANPGFLIKIKLGTNQVATTPGANGTWSVQLPPMPAGGPYELSVVGFGGTTFHNVLMGDVWFCAGQSNMRMPLHIAFHTNKDIQTANNPRLRFFQVKSDSSANLEKDVFGKWELANPITVKRFSAVAYFFSRELFANTKIPIGIIESSSHGGLITASMSKDALAEINNVTKDNYWSTTFNGIVAPIIGYGIKGMVWYKGETDSLYPFDYAQLFSAMLKDWRQKWNLGNFPCLCVQLPNYPNHYNFTTDSAFAKIREAQLKCSKSIANCYTVITIDTAEATGDLHPLNKAPIGHRLALLCLAKVYANSLNTNNSLSTDNALNTDSPLYTSMQNLGNKLLIHFRPGKLITKDTKIEGTKPEVAKTETAKIKTAKIKVVQTEVAKLGAAKPNGFIISGNDHIFYSANAEIGSDKNSMTVFSNKVPHPVAARYAWADNPKCNLYSKNNLPAAPFRTDSWSTACLMEEKTPSYWLKQAYSTQCEPPDILLLGSDQLLSVQTSEAYVYRKTVDIIGDHHSTVLERNLFGLLNKHLRTFVSTLPRAMVSDQLIVAHALLTNHAKPKLVAIGISPRDFIDADCPPINRTEPFIFFAKNTDLGSTIDSMSTPQKTPLETSPKTSPKTSPESKYHFKDFSPFGWYNTFNPIQPHQILIGPSDGYNFYDNTEEYRRRYGNPFSPQFKVQLNCFDSLLSYLAQQHIKVVVFDLPLTTNNRKLLPNQFWQSYNQKISELCKKYDADFINIDNDVKAFSDKEFTDSIHLNLPGSLRLTTTFALYIANKLHWKTLAELQDNEGKML